MAEVKGVFNGKAAGVPQFLKLCQHLPLSDRHNAHLVVKVSSIEAEETSPELQHTGSVEAKQWPTSFQLLGVFKSEVPGQDLEVNIVLGLSSMPLGHRFWVGLN